MYRRAYIAAVTAVAACLHKLILSDMSAWDNFERIPLR